MYLEPQSTKKPFDLTKFLADQKSNLEELYIVQLAKNLINFKTSKLEELKDFLEYKAQRWENIISNEKSKIEDFLSNNDLFDLNNVQDYKDAKVEDLVELIKLKKLKIGELQALNQLLELKQSKIEEVKNLLDFKKSKVKDLLSNNIITQYQYKPPPVITLPSINIPIPTLAPAKTKPKEILQQQPTNNAVSYHPRTSKSKIK